MITLQTNKGDIVIELDMEKAPISSIDRTLANDHSSRPTLRSAAIGRWKMPKL